MAGLDDPPHIRLIAVNSPQVNAFALPGGVIVVLRGQIEAATSPEELAGVLAHELGHVVARHAMVGAVSEYPVALTFSLLFGSVLGSSAHAAIVVPATSSIATNVRSPTVPTSYTATTFGWLRRAIACASR